MKLAIDGQTLSSADADRGIGTYLRHMLDALPHAAKGPAGGVRFQCHLLLHPSDYGDGPGAGEIRETPPGAVKHTLLTPPRHSGTGSDETVTFDDPDAAYEDALPRARRRVGETVGWVRAHGADALWNPNPLQLGVDPIPRPGLATLAATLHDLTPLAMPEMFLGPAHAAFEAAYRERLAHLARHADLLICVSEATRRDAMALGGWPAADLAVVHHGVIPVFRRYGAPGTDAAADLTDTDRAVAADGLGPLPDRFALAVGGHNPKKNLDRLLAAFDRLRRAAPASHPDRADLAPGTLVMAGPLDDRDWREITRLRDRLAPGLTLRRAGYVSDATLAALYRRAALLAFPSLHEGFGLPAAEAMACGCPVLASHAGALPEICDGAALLADPTDTDALADGLDRLWNDQALREQCRARGLEVAARYDWRRTAAETVEAIETRVKRTVAMTLGAALTPPRLLWYSPLPPDGGGVSAYSESLVAELRNDYEINLVHYNTYVARREFDEQTELRHIDVSIKAIPNYQPPSEAVLSRQVIFPDQAEGHYYDGHLPVYHMGNNLSQSRDTWAALNRRPGLVAVHDLNIHGFLLELLVREQQPAKPGRTSRTPSPKSAATDDHPYLQALREAHGVAGESTARYVLSGLGDPDIAALPCHRLLSARAAALLVHAPWARRRLDFDGYGTPVFSVPLGMDDLAAQAPDPATTAAWRAATLPGTPPDTPIAVCAGFLEPSRRLDRVIEAVAAAGPRWHLLAAGAIDPAHRRWLETHAAGRGLAGRVTFTGALPRDSDFLAALSSATAVVHLRHPTNGETSATVLRALALGRPALVSDTDAYRDLPDDCCWKVDIDPRLEVPVLAAYLRRLESDPHLRAAIAHAARRHVAERHAWPVAADAWREAIAATARHMATRRSLK